MSSRPPIRPTSRGSDHFSGIWHNTTIALCNRMHGPNHAGIGARVKIATEPTGRHSEADIGGWEQYKRCWHTKAIDASSLLRRETWRGAATIRRSGSGYMQNRPTAGKTRTRMQILRSPKQKSAPSLAGQTPAFVGWSPAPQRQREHRYRSHRHERTHHTSRASIRIHRPHQPDHFHTDPIGLRSRFTKLQSFVKYDGDRDH